MEVVGGPRAALLELALREEFSLSDAAELDRLVKAHHEKFLAVSCPPGITISILCPSVPTKRRRPKTLF